MARWLKRVGVVMAAGCIAAMSGTARAQTAPPTARFEVATVKPTGPNAQGSELMIHGDGFDTRNISLKEIMKFAYGLNMSGDQQIVGGPKWMAEAKWDIDAKEDAETAAALDKLRTGERSEERMDQVRSMVRTLIEERFHLKVHRESREMPVYVLVVAKSGVKMAPAKAIAMGANGRPASWSGLSSHARGDMEGRSATPAMLANTLGRQPEIGGRTVLDKTGLTGKYDFELKWTADMMAANGESNGPSLFTALEEELGLKLEATKAPVEVVVIDGVEEPTAN